MAKNKKKRFYKKKKLEDEPKKLPKNSRFITENILSDHVVFFIGIISIVIVTFAVAFDLYATYKGQKQIAAEKIRMTTSLAFWQNEVKERPNYRDGYFSLAILYYQLKDYRNASENLDKAMTLDPNFEKGKELRSILDSN